MSASAPPSDRAARRRPPRRSAPGVADGARRPPRPRTEPVRLAAARALLTFLGGGAFAAEPPATLRDEAQRRLYVQLLRGIVRHRRLLETEAERLAGRPLTRLDPEAVALLLLGLYQLRFLDVAPHAAVYETVALAPALRKPHLKGLLNAVLRAAQREGLRETATPEPLPLPVRASYPDWMVARWEAHYGADAAAAVCHAGNLYEGAALRVETGRIRPAELVARLAAEDVAAEPHPLLPDALWVAQLGGLLRSRAFREGLCYVQDVSSQLLMAWAGPSLRGRVLDVCAAPGGKLSWLLGRRDPADWVVGAELLPGRLAQVRENVHRLRLPPAPLLLADAAHLPFRTGSWDAVVLDAPCSATGMIRKYPELKWRKHEADLPRFSALQADLLREAVRVLRPGGRVLYATCSLEPEENEAVVARVLAEQPDLRRRSLAELSPPAGLGVAPDTLLSAVGDLQLLPADRQMGLYAALLERTG